jgi:predicted membrane protein
LSFEVMLLLVLGPIILLTLGLIIGLIKKNKTAIIIFLILWLIFLVRAILICFVVLNWTPMN